MKKLKNLYLSSVHTSSGKTEVALGLGLMLQDKGYKVGYFKPFSRRKGKADYDTEVQIVAKSLNLDESLVSPVFLDPVYFETMNKQKDEFRKKILAGYKKIKDCCDVVIIEGAKKFNNFMSFDLDDATLAFLMDNSAVMSVNTFEKDEDICDLLMQKDMITRRKASYIGCMLTHVTKIMASRAVQEFIPYLKNAGIKCFGVVEKDDRLTSPTFREVMENLGGKLLDEDCECYDIDVLVKQVLIGAMSAHSALSYFRSSGQNAVVITGGDRSDIVLTALETNISGIILTGNLYPDSHVISAAREKRVPIILVPGDTFTTATRVETTAAELQ
nr:DRTGG domain-containing protein [Candidatus Sigynarchaeota archaeon]